MNLLLWRHAEAAEGEPGQHDLDRRLTLRGEKQARRMANWLQEHGPQTRCPMRILVSPAVRCQQTVQALDLAYDTHEGLHPEAEVSTLLSAAQWKKDKARNTAILLVGHQPTLGRLAACLLSGKQADWHIKKGALWWLTTGQGQREGSQHVFLKAVINPGFL